MPLIYLGLGQSSSHCYFGDFLLGPVRVTSIILKKRFLLFLGLASPLLYFTELFSLSEFNSFELKVFQSPLARVELWLLLSLKWGASRVATGTACFDWSEDPSYVFIHVLGTAVWFYYYFIPWKIIDPNVLVLTTLVIYLWKIGLKVRRLRKGWFQA